MLLRPVILSAALTLVGVQARAGEAACWFEHGVVVAPAQVMGIAGDFILDTATPHTQLAETRAQGAGFADTALIGEVRLAGLRLENRPVEVADLDLRTGALPTPIAGVIGADVLRTWVLDLRFTPCRVALNMPRRRSWAPRGVALPIRWIAGRPTVPAGVADGARTRQGAFAPGTGYDVSIRLSDAVASAPGAAKPSELYPGGALRPRLAALSFAGDLSQALPAGLMAAEDSTLSGVIGAPLLARYRLRFDFPAGRLWITPDPPAAPGPYESPLMKKGPGSRRGP